MWAQVQSQISGVLVELFLLFLTLLCAMLIRYARKAITRAVEETTHLKSKTAAELLENALWRLDDVVTRVVQKIEQTTAGELRQAVKDGKVDRKELLALSKQAYREIVETLGAGTINILEGGLGDLRKYIESSIEAKVHEVKLVDKLGGPLPDPK